MASYRKQIRSLLNNRYVHSITTDAKEDKYLHKDKSFKTTATINTDNFKFKSKYYIKGFKSKESSLSEAFLPDTSNSSIRLGLLMLTNAPFKNQAEWVRFSKVALEVAFTPIALVQLTNNLLGGSSSSNLHDLYKNNSIANYADSVATSFLKEYNITTIKGARQLVKDMETEIRDMQKYVDNIVEGDDYYTLKYNKRSPQNEVIHISNVSTIRGNRGALIGTNGYYNLVDVGRILKVIKDILKTSEDSSDYDEIKDIIKDPIKRYSKCVDELHTRIAKVLEKI